MHSHEHASSPRRRRLSAPGDLEEILIHCTLSPFRLRLPPPPPRPFSFLSFEPSFLSDPPSSGAPSAPPSSMGPTLSGVGDDPALPPGGDAGGGGVGVVPGA